MSQKYNNDGNGCKLPMDMLLSEVQEITNRLSFFENYISASSNIPFEGEPHEMATKINRSVKINAKQYWIHANTEQEYVDKVIAIFLAHNQSSAVDKSVEKHIFKDYAIKWFEVYSKPNIEIVTATTYERQLTKHLIPYFGDMAIEDITTDDVQRFFNGMQGAKATKDKAKTVLNMVLDNAIEDGVISKNPLKSKRIKVTGAASKTTEPYTVEQMRFFVSNLEKIQNPTDRMYLALQALHPLRLEEVLGLKWRDIDVENMVLHIRRAVTHPTRNQPEIKDTKTTFSARDLGLVETAKKYLTLGEPDDFVIGGKNPFSYTQVRRMCERIQKDIEFKEKITPIRFRTTVLTDIYNMTKDIKQTQLAAGHTTAEMTLKHYVQGRNGLIDAATAIQHVYS